MGITNSAYLQLLKEYDERRLRSIREFRSRTQKIEEQLPELPQINRKIARLAVEQATARIYGTESSREDYQRQRDALIRRREELLAAAGYSSEDLEPHYLCSKCQDTGFVDNRPCSCFRSRIIELLYDQSNIRDILKQENFSNYTLQYYSHQPLPGNPEESPFSIAQKALSTAREFVRQFAQSSDNLFISGDTGTGKTFLSNCVAAEILNQGFSVIYLSAVRLFGILADSTFQGQRSGQKAEDLYSCDLLIIDDLGTEYTNSFVQSAFFNCMNERLLRGRHTIISTNLSMEQIRDNYSERVFSRIAEKYKLIRLYGEDIRVLKKLEE